MRVFVFGDSIALGFGDVNGGWVQQMTSVLYKTSLHDLTQEDAEIAIESVKTTHIEVYNLSVSADTSSGVLSRLKDEVEARQMYEQEEVIMLAVGINDATLKADNMVLMDVYQFQEIYEKIITEAQELGARVVCVGLTAVDEKQTTPWGHSSTGKQYLNNRINLFEDTIKQSAERLSVPFIPLHDEFLAKVEAGEDMLFDGLHPNQAGHTHVAKTVLQHLHDILV